MTVGFATSRALTPAKAQRTFETFDTLEFSALSVSSSRSSASIFVVLMCRNLGAGNREVEKLA